jgi:hypothetical protein
MTDTASAALQRRAEEWKECNDKGDGYEEDGREEKERDEMKNLDRGKRLERNIIEIVMWKMRIEHERYEKGDSSQMRDKMPPFTHFTQTHSTQHTQRTRDRE